MKKLIIFLMVLVLCLNIAYGIGVYPGRSTLDFEHGLKKSVDFTLVNNEDKDMKVLLRVEGELAEYVTLHNVVVDFRKGESEKKLRYDVNLPERIEKPGMHGAEIIATELPKDITSEGTFVGGSVAVVTQLYVRVPYPGKYAEVELDVSEANAGEDVVFVVPVHNLGTDDIIRASGEIEILGPTNEKIAAVNTNELNIKSRDKRELIGRWNADVNPGMYHAVVHVDYDGKMARAEKTFGVGSLMIEVIDINVKNFRLGGVAKFDITVENRWNEDINDAYAQMLLYNDKGDGVADFKSADYGIKALSKDILNAYWDTEGVKEGAYDGKVVLHYQGKTTEKQLKSYVGIDSIRTEFLGTGYAVKGGINKQGVLGVLVVVLIIINIAWWFYFRRIRK